MYLFGQDFTYTFTPFLDNETIASIPSQTATFYLFDSRPDNAAALNGTGATQTVTATWTASATSCSFSVDAVDDPDPDSTVDEVEYYASVKFTLSSAEQTQFSIRTLKFVRVVGNDAELSVVSADLESIYPSLTTYCGSTRVTNAIALAKSWLKRKLKDKGYEYSQIENLQDFKLVVSYRALSQLIISLVQAGNSQFETLYKEYKDSYTELFDSLTIEYDSDRDGDTDVIEKIPNFQIISR